MRLPIASPLVSRDGAANKDARLTNMLKEMDGSRELAVVRPGLSLVVNGTGVGGGIVAFNGELVSVYGTTLGVGVIPESSALTVTAAPDPTETMNVIDYLNTEYITFNVDSGTGQLITYTGDGTSLTPAAYGLVTGNEAISAAMGPLSYVVVTRDAGAGYGAFMEVFMTSTTGAPSFSIVKTSNSYSCLRGDCVYSNGRFIIPCEDIGVVIGARIYSSSDNGATFSSVNIAGFRPGGVTWDGSRWIIYGSDLDDTNPRAYYSTDLATFTALTLSGLTPDYIPLQVVTANGMFYAQCQSVTQTLTSALFSSPDGVAWTMVSNSQFYGCDSVKVLDDVLYIGTRDMAGYPTLYGALYKLTEQDTWQQVFLMSNEYMIYDVATDGTSVSGTGQQIIPDQIIWLNNLVTPAYTPPIGTVATGIYDFAQGPL